MYRHITYYILFIIGFIPACTEMPDKYPCDNAKDPECDGYVEPGAKLVSSPSQGEIIDTNMVTITWDGNQTSSVFSYRISEASNWSDWSYIKSITYECMPDNDYTFYVREAYPNGDEQDQATAVSFSIDYISGTSIVLEDQCINTNVDSEFDLFVSLEEVHTILGAFISVSFDPATILLTQRQAMTGIFGIDLADLVFIATEVQEANNNGLIEINMARFNDVSGTSEDKQIVQLRFKAISTASTQVVINSSSELRDVNNDVIMIEKLVNATVNIQ